MTKIQRISKYMKLGCLTYMPIPILASLLLWFTAHKIPFIEYLYKAGYISISHAGKPIDILSANMTALARTVGFFGSFLTDLFTVLIFYFLYQLLSLYEKGKIFSHQHVRLFKNMGYTTLGYATLGLMFSDTLLTLGNTLSNPPGQRILAIGFGTPNIEFAFYGLIGVLLSWIMAEGLKLKSDQELTI